VKQMDSFLMGLQRQLANTRSALSEYTSLRSDSDQTAYMRAMLKRAEAYYLAEINHYQRAAERKNKKEEKKQGSNKL
jgi:Skp family chaperone for outer membrane proteins